MGYLKACLIKIIVRNRERGVVKGIGLKNVPVIGFKLNKFSKTGVILNLKHKDIEIFLRYSFNLFRLKVNKILKEMPIIKVNTTLCANFIKKSNEK